MGSGQKWFADAMLDCEVNEHHWLGDRCMVCNMLRPKLECFRCRGDGWVPEEDWYSGGCNLCEGKGFVWADGGK